MSGKRRSVSARKLIKRKDKDKPKRPLSAYNFFFKEEREKITRALYCKDENYRGKIDPELDLELVTKLNKGEGKVCFEELGKLIGRRWQAQKGKDKCSYYYSLAEADTERYKLDVDAYTRRREEIRREAYIENYHTPYPMHHDMHNYQRAMNSYPSYDMHYEPMGCMNGYHYHSNAVHGHGMHMAGRYHPYYRYDIPYDNNHQQNHYRSDFRNSTASYPDGHAMSIR